MADIDEQIDDTLEPDAPKEAKSKKKQATEDTELSYRVYEEAKIPVSSKMGTLWESRVRAAKRMREHDRTEDRWSAALNYYYNDMSPMNQEGKPVRDASTYLVGSDVTEVENLIFSNAHSLIPAIYAKNPDIEITPIRTTGSQTDETESEQQIDFRVRLYERLVDRLFAMREAPGVNMKVKTQRVILQTHLLERSYYEVGYIRKEESSEQALNELTDLSEELKNAKDTKTIEEVEGKINAIEHKIDFLSQSGPFVKVRRAFDVVIDPNSTLPDLTDARWIAIADFPETAMLNAMYGKKDSETGEYKTVYHPSHVLTSDRQDRSSEGMDYSNLIQLKDNASHSAYGFKTDTEFQRMQRTLVWYVWDKTTRRILMYADADWKWPVWVWDDPYGFPSFFPLRPMFFNVDPENQYSRSEVVYQLDMQDAVNQCNSQKKRVRRLASDVFLYDSRLPNDVVDKMLKGAQQGPTGIPVDTISGELKLQDAISPLMAPVAKSIELFDKREFIEAFNRMSSVSNVLKGVEYKTNTTNKAIESYEGGQQMRLDEKIDAVEDALGDVGNMVLQLCVKFMPAEVVAEITEMDEAVQLWEQMEPKDFSRKFQLQIVGGSALKPTSKLKKEEADATVQRLGQFASASPVAFLIALKIYAKAYDATIVTKEDWDMLRSSIEATITQQNAQAGGGKEGAPAKEGEGTEEGEGVTVTGDALEKLLAGIDQMPDEVRQELATAITSGEPIADILARLTQGE